MISMLRAHLWKEETVQDSENTKSRELKMRVYCGLEMYCTRAKVRREKGARVA